MGLLSRIFARPEDGSKIVDGAISTLDNAFFTKQERSDASAKVSEFYLKYLAMTKGQDLARRFIALIVVLLWVTLILAGIIAKITTLLLTPEYTVPNYEISNFIFKVLTDIVFWPFNTVIGFYFLTHTVRAFQKKPKE